MPRKAISLVILLFSILFLTGAAFALEFSADTVLTSDGQKTYGKIYSKTDRFRMEITQPEHMTTITRMDKMIAWNIMHSQKMYMEMPFNPKSAPKTEIHGEIDRKQVGTETIDGHPAKKYLITYKEGSHTEKVYQWLATDINFPVKTADINNKWIQEYKNIKIGSQPNSLFELPEGYKKMHIPKMPDNMKFK